jgi:RNA polymerase sigma-70 factor (ECF subfamily)
VSNSEDRLVEQAKSDPAAFGALYERYVERIYNYIYHRTGNQHDAEDLTARTFYKALLSLGGYTERGVPFSAWLYRIAHNLVANWHRDHQRRKWVPLDDPAAGALAKGTPDLAIEPHDQASALLEVAEQHEEERALLDAVRELHPDRQLLLILKFSEELSNAEIGRIMGRSEGAVKSLYHRTLLALRDQLEMRGFS